MKPIAILLVLAAAAAFFVPAVSASSQKPAPLNLTSSGLQGQSNYVLEKQNAYYYDASCNCSRIDPSHGYLVNARATGNETGCVWDINDHLDGQTGGYVNPGALTSRTDCMMAGVEPLPACYSIGSPSGDGCYNWSGNDHWYGYAVLSSAPTLQTQACFQPEARCWTLTAPTTYNSEFRAWEYDFCVEPGYSPDDPNLSIPAGTLRDANGNVTDVIPYGSFPYTRQEAVTLAVSNTGAKQVKQVSAYYGFSSDIFFPAGCVGWHWTVGDTTPNNGTVPKQYEYPFRWVTQ